MTFSRIASQFHASQYEIGNVYNTWGISNHTLKKHNQSTRVTELACRIIYELDVYPASHI